MGRITCANVLSDLYATGVTHCDNMLMLLGVSTDLSDKERGIVLPLIMKGFSDLASEAGSSVNGGQTVRNPWMLIGGVATSVVKSDQLIPYDLARPGDSLVLTKPLGTRLVCNAYQWYDQNTPTWQKVKHIIPSDKLKTLYLETAQQMASLNIHSATKMHSHQAHACTDVTGFGILGHAQNLVSFQKCNVDFVIHTLPLISYSKELAEECGIDFKLFDGLCAETSGGLLICMPKEQAESFCSEMIHSNGQDRAWIVGEVVNAVITDVP
ncbi:hypothetical protein MXB_257 [Myxobolus squamalis]|nr:hypothetical protein MXB_257 [Myxobolus squamalis]